MKRPAKRSAVAPPAALPAVDLRVRIGPLELANPVVTASGTFGYGDEYAHLMDVAALGAVITKTVTVKPRAGNAPQRIAETPSGMLNSIGLENVGLERFQAQKLPTLRALGATIIASLGGETPHELEHLLGALGGEPGVGGFEINFSCPNVAKGGTRYWAVPRRLERTLRRLRPLTQAALIAKLPPEMALLPDLARACEAGGADALTAVNTFVGMSVDLSHMRFRIGRGTGGLSGPAIKPLALACCAEAVRSVTIPVMGSGGIMNATDALEFIAVGATAVQVGTLSFIRPRGALEVLDGLVAPLAARGVRRLADWRGCMLRAEPAQPAAAGPSSSPRKTARAARAASAARLQRKA